MRRTFFILSAVAMLCAVSTAQPGDAPLTAAERLAMLRANRVLIDDLVDDGLALAAQNRSLDATELAVGSSTRLAVALQRAIADGDADRMSELGDHLDAMIGEAVVPGLREAKSTIPPGSPDYVRYLAVHKKAFERLSPVAEEVPIDGKGWTVDRIRRCRERLAATLSQIGKPPMGE